MTKTELLKRAQKNLAYRLFDAGRDGDVEAATRAIDEGLEEGADINGKNEDGRTPLHTACAHGHVNVVRLLLERGADPNARDNSGETPFDHAVRLECAYDRDEVTSILLECFPGVARQSKNN
ncbi:MAG TPA: ankyrin repeat domain-containing protein [Syntrophorhabdaceae bacterium]|jgi:ankyrin repeat protein|uniref:Ankyrin repeat domain-containing protein n=1 Tax=Syntrophorhabdus aromaticivorans TaxID=328301 RepID=A0A971S2H8_9BACT|nr:ankyrin repeat domain-containing protein [Syntrophorhabdaceae bacterium]NLW36302.1 hypothetical protein [Syntrophorhabdus aromaticivorans]OPY66827.1 MAG: Ankyrin repeat protein [Syntrophorhabdaceae bacterium PtaU1.Bin034]HOW55229.1 ankyrin repeat domain-containing protein [Syntrophorhabdaceae bacterium]